jgi:hypothetical protein
MGSLNEEVILVFYGSFAAAELGRCPGLSEYYLRSVFYSLYRMWNPALGIERAHYFPMPRKSWQTAPRDTFDSSFSSSEQFQTVGAVYDRRRFRSVADCAVTTT